MYIVIYGMLHHICKTKKEALAFASALHNFEKVEIYKLGGIVK